MLLVESIHAPTKNMHGAVLLVVSARPQRQITILEGSDPTEYPHKDYPIQMYPKQPL